MRVNDKTKEQLLKELSEMRQRIAELEKSEAELWQTKEKLSKSEKELSSIYDSITDFMTVIDTDYRIARINRVVEKHFGRDIIGKVCYEVYQGRKEICPDCPTRKAIETKKTAFSFQPATEVSLPVDINAFPIFNEEGDVIAVVEHGKDVTERKKVEECLEKARVELEMRVKERTAELESIVKLLKEEITERKRIENELQETEKSLIARSTELTESNAALKALLRQREEDRKEIENNILSNIKHLVQPYIEKLKKNKPVSDELTYLKILESNLEEIVSPFASKLSSKYLGFSPRELQVADLIKDGKQDKDIIEILNISPDTIKIHRKNIRRKLGIYREKINLRTKLLSLDK